MRGVLTAHFYFAEDYLLSPSKKNSRQYMIDTEAIIHWLQGLPPWGVYAFLFAVCFIENIFPPSPSDVVMLFLATLIGIGTIGHIPAIAIATLGSVTGFYTAFWLGRRYGAAIIRSPWLPFLNESHIHKVEKWFTRWGYGVIVANRFLAGTRAVISFAAGMSKLDATRTTIYCSLSALAWNVAIIELGAWLGGNWRQGEKLLSQYGIAISIILGVLVLVWLIRKYLNRHKKDDEDQGGEGIAGDREKA